jgi:leucyl-tRNA synthetase
MKAPPIKRELEYEGFNATDYITGGNNNIVCAEVTCASAVDDIKPGDRVFIDSEKTPVDGDIIAVWIGDDITVMKYTQARLRIAARDGKRIADGAKPKVLPPGIIGVITCFVRKFE